MNQQTESVNRFIEFAAINVNEHIKKKVGLSYLSWPLAVDQLLRRDPTATWEYGEPKLYGETMMVYCTVTAFGQPRTMQLPVMDHRNKAISNPNSFEVNTAMHRCLVKAIALHGLGLYIYTGEDLPIVKGDGGQEKKPNTAAQVAQDAFDALPEEAQQVTREWAMEIIALVGGGDADEAAAFIKKKCEDQESKLALWSQLPADARSAIKKAEQAAKS